MNKKTFSSIAFASLFFGALAVLNYISTSDLDALQVVTESKNNRIKAITPPIISQATLETIYKTSAVSNQEVTIAAYNNFLSAPPRYLQGTDIRGEFHIDDQGNLIITASIKQRFEYFFLMTEHISLTDIINIIQGHLYSELTDPALTTAINLLTDYLDYFNQYNVLLSNQSPKDNHNVYELAEKISQLRIDTLGEEVNEIFFGQSQALQAQNLKRLAIENDVYQFSPSSDLPEKLQKNQQATLSYALSKQTIQKALQDGANEEELTALRTQLYGEEAALRLQELDIQRAQWNQHLSNYQALNTLLEQTGMNSQQILSQLQSTFSQDYGLTDMQINQLTAQARMAMASLKK